MVKSWFPKPVMVVRFYHLMSVFKEEVLHSSVGRAMAF